MCCEGKQSGTSERYQLKYNVKDERSVVLTLEAAHRRYHEHAKCSYVPEDKGYLGVQSRYGAIEPRSGTLGWESSSRLDVFSGVID
jgi:hypothetical protein